MPSTISCAITTDTLRCKTSFSIPSCILSNMRSAKLLKK
uniref:Uncharacterized protein n=1 Tax=Ascaris lumbricoides TaxID=6252 RepID=A0A0M3ID89_ASCLU